MRQDPGVQLANQMQHTPLTVEESVDKKAASRAQSFRQGEIMTSFIKQSVQNAILIEDVGSESVFLLPYSSIQGFPSLFQRIDDNFQYLGITVRSKYIGHIKHIVDLYCRAIF